MTAETRRLGEEEMGSVGGMKKRTMALRWWFWATSPAVRTAYLRRCVAMDCRDGGSRVAALLAREAREPVGVTISSAADDAQGESEKPLVGCSGESGRRYVPERRGDFFGGQGL